MDVVSLKDIGAQSALVVLFGLTLTYLFRTVIPNMQKNFSENLERVTQAFSESQIKILDRLEGTERAIDKNSIILLRHDATVRGENPEILGETRDILEILRNTNGRSSRYRNQE